MPAFTFVTRFALRTPPPAVFAAVRDPLPWLRQVPYTRAATQVRAGGPQGVGARYRGTVRAPLPYRLTWAMETVASQPPTSIAWRAWGDLEGTACWQMTADGPLTRVRVTWRVTTAHRWMDRLGPLVRPALVWSHDRVMTAGVRVLADHLGSPVLDHSQAASSATAGRRPAPQGQDTRAGSGVPDRGAEA